MRTDLLRKTRHTLALVAAIAITAPAATKSAPAADSLVVIEQMLDFKAPTGPPGKVETRFIFRLEFRAAPGAPIVLTATGEDGEAEKFCLAGSQKDLALRGYVRLVKQVGIFSPGRILRGSEKIEINTREDCAGAVLGPATGGAVNPENGRWICVSWVIMPCRDTPLKVVLYARQMPRMQNILDRECPPALPALCAPGDYPLVINEFMAHNTRTLADPQQQFDSWIELYNTSSDSVSAKNLFLSDDPAAPLKWSFPDSLSVPAGGYMLIWADADTSAGAGLHTNFTLRPHGGSLFLTFAEGRESVLWDSVGYPAQAADVSFGRVRDGERRFAPQTASSPGGPNQIASAVGEARAVPAGIDLQQNYPNPFNPQTQITYRLPEAGRVELRVYNLRGQTVRTLVAGWQPAGQFVISWSGVDWRERPVAGGLYFYELVLNGRHVRRRKMLLVK